MKLKRRLITITYLLFICCNLSFANAQEKSQILLVSNDQLFVTLPGENLILVSTNIDNSALKTYELTPRYANAVLTTEESTDGIRGEAVGGTGGTCISSCRTPKPKPITNKGNKSSCEATGGTGDLCRGANTSPHSEHNGPSTKEASSGTGGIVGDGSNAPIVTDKLWGYAEVLMHCYNADVIIYQEVNGQAVEVLATNIPTNDCTYK